jgi:hypothetical protein
MTCGYLPFEDKNNSDLFRKIVSNRVEFPHYIQFIYKDLIKKVLVNDPGNRYSASEIKRHQVYKNGLSGFFKDHPEYMSIIDEQGEINEAVREKIKSEVDKKLRENYNLIAFEPVITLTSTMSNASTCSDMKVIGEILYTKLLKDKEYLATLKREATCNIDIIKSINKTYSHGYSLSLKFQQTNNFERKVYSTRLSCTTSRFKQDSTDKNTSFNKVIFSTTNNSFNVSQSPTKKCKRLSIDLRAIKRQADVNKTEKTKKPIINTKPSKPVVNQTNSLYNSYNSIALKQNQNKYTTNTLSIMFSERERALLKSTIAESRERPRNALLKQKVLRDLSLTHDKIIKKSITPLNTGVKQIKTKILNK